MRQHVLRSTSEAAAAYTEPGTSIEQSDSLGSAELNSQLALVAALTSSRVSRAAFLSASVARQSDSFFQAPTSMEQLSAPGGSVAACRHQGLPVMAIEFRLLPLHDIKPPCQLHCMQDSLAAPEGKALAFSMPRCRLTA